MISRAYFKAFRRRPTQRREDQIPFPPQRGEGLGLGGPVRGRVFVQERELRLGAGEHPYKKCCGDVA